MPIYHIERGGHAAMRRIYPMMTFDFHDWERPTQLECQRAMLRGAELLLLKNQQNAECGYALMLKSRLTGYVLLGWLAVYPHVRGGGIGGQFLTLIREHYEGWSGILLEVTEYPALEKARKLNAFYKRNGYADVNCKYTLGGRATQLMYMPLAGAKDIAPAVRSAVRSVYECMYSESELWRLVQIEKDENV